MIYITKCRACKGYGPKSGLLVCEYCEGRGFHLRDSVQRKEPTQVADTLQKILEGLEENTKERP